MIRTGLISVGVLALLACSGEEADPAAEAKARAEALMENPPEEGYSTPDIKAVWAEGCFDAFLDLVVRKPGDEKAYSLPFIGVYDSGLTPVYHEPGYRISDEDGWSQAGEWHTLLDSGMADDGPSIEALSPFVMVDGAPLDSLALSAADTVFVKYSADWCVPCKLQSLQVQEYRDLYPEENVMHVEIKSDFMALREMPESERPQCSVDSEAI